MITAQATFGDLTDLLALAPPFTLGTDASPPPPSAVRVQFDVAATVTIDDRGYARVVLHDPLGHAPGDRIPLWSVAEGRPIGALTVSTGVIRNGQSLI